MNGPVDLKKKFPGLERRKFALPQKFISLQSLDIEAQNDVRNSSGPGGNSNKIGFFHLNQMKSDGSSSDDEYSGGGFQSDSSSDSTTSESDDGIVFPTGTDKRRPVSRTKKMQSSGSGVSERRRRPMPLKRNSRNNPGDSNLTERLTERSLQATTSGQQTGLGASDPLEAGQGRPPIWCRSRSPKIPSATVPSSLVDTGRTMEQVCK